MALLNIVHQILDAFGQALALSFYGFLLGFCIQSQKIGRRRGRHPLLYRKANFVFGVLIGFYGIGQAHECFGIEQVRTCGESSHGVGCPCLAGKSTVFDVVFGFEAMVPECAGLFQVGGLNFLELFLRKCERRYGFFCRRHNTSQVHGLKCLHGLAPAFGKVLLKLFASAGPQFIG